MMSTQLPEKMQWNGVVKAFHKIFDVIAEHLGIGDEIECAFPGKHENKDGYIILSKKKMLFAQADHLIRGIGHLFFEIPLWTINSIDVDQDHFVIIANDGDNYSFESFFSNEVKEEFEKLKGEEVQYSVMPLISQIQ